MIRDFFCWLLLAKGGYLIAAWRRSQRICHEHSI